MSYEDFKDYFSAVTICRINDSYTYHFFKTKHAKDSHCVLRLEVTNPGFVYISADQMEENCFPKVANYHYSYCRLVIAKEGENGLEYIDGKHGIDRNLWLSLNLEPGAYQVYVEYEWASNVKQFVVSTYGEATVVFQHIGEVPDFLKTVYSSRALVSGVEVNIPNNPGLVKYHELLPEGFGYFYLNNPLESKIYEKCYFKSFKNLSLLPPFSGAKYEVALEAGVSEIVIIKCTSGEKPVLSFTSTITIDQVLNPLEEKTKREGTPEKRVHPETKKEIGVTIYTLKHTDGMYLLYENSSKNLLFEETIEFILKNSKIVGIAGKKVNVALNPGERHFIEIQSTAKSWSVQKSCSFTIS